MCVQCQLTRTLSAGADVLKGKISTAEAADWPSGQDPPSSSSSMMRKPRQPTAVCVWVVAEGGTCVGAHFPSTKICPAATLMSLLFAKNTHISISSSGLFCTPDLCFPPKEARAHGRCPQPNCPSSSLSTGRGAKSRQL